MHRATGMEVGAMGTRDAALVRARGFFDGGFAERLAGLVAIPSTSQDPGHEADVRRYLEEGIRPWLEAHGVRGRDPSQPRSRVRPDPDGRAHRGSGPPDRAHLWAWRHGARARGPVGAGALALDDDRSRRSLVRPGHGRQQGPARAQSLRAGGGAGRARRPARVQPQAGAGDVRGARLDRAARVRGGAAGGAAPPTC